MDNMRELKELPIWVCWNREERDGLEGDPMRIPVILTAYYGLRRSEVLGIKWSAVDFTEKEISICHKIVEDGSELCGLDVMKTKSSYRTLPLIPYIEEILIAEREKQAEMQKVLRGAYSKKYIDYVCVDAIGNLISPQYITTHFPIILNRLGMKKIRFHDLRHSCASLMLANGVPMKMIQDWLGHSNMSTTVNIKYPHERKFKSQGSLNCVEEWVVNKHPADILVQKTNLSAGYFICKSF